VSFDAAEDQIQKLRVQLQSDLEVYKNKVEELGKKLVQKI